MKQAILTTVLLVLIPVCLFAQAKTPPDNHKQIYNAIYATERLYEIERQLNNHISSHGNDSLYLQYRTEYYQILKVFAGDLKNGTTLNDVLKQSTLLKSIQRKILLIDNSAEMIVSFIDNYKRKQDLGELHKVYTDIKKVRVDSNKLYDSLIMYKEALVEYDTLEMNIINTLLSENLLNPDSLKRKLTAEFNGVMITGYKKIDSIYRTYDVLKARIDETQSKLKDRARMVVDIKSALLQAFNNLDHNTQVKLVGPDLINAINSVGFSMDIVLTSFNKEMNTISDAPGMYISTNYNLSHQALAMSMPSQTEMVDAMAIFLANRVKQESVIWFFEELKKNAKLYSDMNCLFPNSMNLIQGNEIYQTPDLGKAWRYAIAQDFVEMPSHIVDISFIKNQLDNSQNSQNIKQYINVGVNIATALQKKYSIEEMLDYLYLNKKEDLGYRVSADHFVTMMYAMKQELFLIEKGQKQWLNPSSVLNMPDDMFITMLSLMDMRYEGFLTKLLKVKSFKDERLKVKDLKMWFAKMLLNIKKLEAIYYEADKNTNSNDNGDVASLNYNIWTYTNDMINVLKDGALSVTKDTTTANNLQLVSDVINIYLEIDRRNYYAALDKCFDIAQQFLRHRLVLENDIATKMVGGDLTKDLQAVSSLYKHSKLDNNAIDSIAHTLADKYITVEDINFVSSIKKGGIVYTIGDRDYELLDSFMYTMKFMRVRKVVSNTARFLTDVSTAKNSKDLSKVVQAYALPPTSYKIKKATMHSWFVNAFVGPYIGYESLSLPNQFNKVKNGDSLNGFVYGLSAPIGITYSIAFRHKSSCNKGERYVKCVNKKGQLTYLGNSPLNVTLSIIDIGAVVSYRIGNTKDVLPQEFKWEQFFSPGLHVSKSIANTPLVISFGAVYTPLIRNIESASRQYNAVRVYTGLFFDIPIFKVYAKDRYANLDYIQ